MIIISKIFHIIIKSYFKKIFILKILFLLKLLNFFFKAFRNMHLNLSFK